MGVAWHRDGDGVNAGSAACAQSLCAFQITMALHSAVSRFGPSLPWSPAVLEQLASCVEDAVTTAEAWCGQVRRSSISHLMPVWTGAGARAGTHVRPWRQEEPQRCPSVPIK